jgi:hypothetical protein
MILSKIELQNMADSARILFTPEQEQAILERFGTEPEPHEWTGQDIACQIDNYLYYGAFEKPVIVHGIRRPLPEGAF